MESRNHGNPELGRIALFIVLYIEDNGMFAVIGGASERPKDTEAELVGVCLREERV